MQALILAAGGGTRLGGSAFESPKCLLEVGRRALIEHQLEILASAGVGPVAMVVGYCADEIREVVGYQAEYIPNPRWSVTNSLYSFSLARDWVRGPLIILNCDILFHPRVIDRLLAVKGDAFAYDSGSGDGREHMKVKLDGDRLVSMSKEMSPEKVAGENVGILKLTAETVSDLFDEADRRVADQGEKLWLGSAVCEIARERTLRAVDVAGLPWGEIDFPYDLDHVRKEIWPAIRRTTGKPASRRRVAAIAAIVLTVVMLFLTRAWLPAEVIAWEAVDDDSVAKVKIYAGERSQNWLLLEAGRGAETQLSGPAKVCVDSRVVLPPDATGDTPYVLELVLDGERLDWHKESAKASSTWTHPEWTLGKRRRIAFEVPEGEHTLSIRLVAAESNRILLRVRQGAPDDGDE